MKFAGAVLSAFAAGICVALVAVSFYRNTGMTARPAGVQVSVVASPDNVYSARVWLPELGGLGATVSQPHQVWMDSRLGESWLMFEADKTDGIKVRWLGNRLLEVCYEDAQISTFRNRFIDVDRTASETKVQTVEVRLRYVQRIDGCY